MKILTVLMVVLTGEVGRSPLGIATCVLHSNSNGHYPLLLGWAVDC